MKTIKTKLKGLIAVAAAFSLIAIFNTSAEAQGFRIFTSMELSVDDPIFGDPKTYWVARMYAYKSGTGGNNNNAAYFDEFDYHYSFDGQYLENPKYLIIKNTVPVLSDPANDYVVTSSGSSTQGIYTVTEGSSTTLSNGHTEYRVIVTSTGGNSADDFVGADFDACVPCGEIFRVYMEVKPGVGGPNDSFPFFNYSGNQMPNEIYYNPAATGYLANVPNSSNVNPSDPGIIPTNPDTNPWFYWPYSSMSTTYWSAPSGYGAQGVSSFRYGGFSEGTELDPLPVEYASFNAIYNAKAHEVAVQWTTAMELNNSHFTVEHSVDGENWMALSVVEGNGTTYEQIDYEYIHNQPVRGANFYRLIQEDFDGTQAPSNTIMVYVSESELAPNIRLYPNPSFGTLNIEGTSNPKVTVFNTAGVSLLVSENQNTIDLSHLKTGVYFIQVEDASGITSKHRFIKE